MLKVYYGDDCKSALGSSPLYTNNASQIKSMEQAYGFVHTEEITYEDVEAMGDEKRIELYEEKTGIRLEEVNDEFWDWAVNEIGVANEYA